MQLTSAVHPVFITREKESLVADSNRAAVRLETHAQKQVSFCGHKVFLRLLEERKHLGGSSPLTGAGESLSVCGHKVSLRSGPVPGVFRRRPAVQPQAEQSVSPCGHSGVLCSAWSAASLAARHPHWTRGKSLSLLSRAVPLTAAPRSRGRVSVRRIQSSVSVAPSRAAPHRTGSL